MWAEARARAVGGSPVERHSQDSHVVGAHIADVVQKRSLRVVASYTSYIHTVYKKVPKKHRQNEKKRQDKEKNVRGE